MWRSEMRTVWRNQNENWEEIKFKVYEFKVYEFKVYEFKVYEFKVYW